jgi:hypothetical protein
MHPGSRVLCAILCQNGGLSVLSSIGELEDDSHVVFGQKFPGAKESVRRCIVVMKQSAVLPVKFGAKSSHIFKQLQ